MIKHRFMRGLRMLLFVVALLAVLSGLVMSLWNTLLPALFGWRSIEFLQAAGLLILCRLLFGGLRGPGFGPPWRHSMHARWAHMSPEERERFRAGLRQRCGEKMPGNAGADEST